MSPVENQVALERAGPSRDPEVDPLSWEKTQTVFTHNGIDGQYYGLGGVAPGRPQAADNITILEVHGGTVEESCRNIDDGKGRGHNSDYAAQLILSPWRFGQGNCW